MRGGGFLNHFEVSLDDVETSGQWARGPDQQWDVSAATRSQGLLCLVMALGFVDSFTH